MKKKEYMNILKENVLQTVSSNWSTQSPDLNSTENLWDELKTKIQEGVAKKNTVNVEECQWFAKEEWLWLLGKFVKN